MSKKNRISVKEIQNKNVEFLPDEYENYRRILDFIVEKGVLFCKQKAAVRNQLLELSQSDDKIMSAAYRYCTELCKQQIQTQLPLQIYNNIAIKNEPNKSEIEKTPMTIQEPEDSRNPRNFFLKKISLCFMLIIILLIIAGLFYYIKNDSDMTDIRKKVEEFKNKNHAIENMLLVMRNEHEKKEEMIAYLEAEIQRKESQYNKLSFEFNKIVNILELENDERHQILKKIKAEIDSCSDT
ncbi:24517_t:CDS:2 [Dentiscutata erythropus]|uniref:24517_t:CDS:1 n=1 Tax=Dentiscutata erythropus TaxID=1348616 RepID=A0A9N9F5P7_9GLOM|nr:24517_t:CDS:2 [Dentiscutata erythropus]